MPATKNTPSIHHPQRLNVTTSMIGLKTVIYANIIYRVANGFWHREFLEYRLWNIELIANGL